MCTVVYVYIITFILFCIIYTYTMHAPINLHAYVCSIVYIYRYCVCPHGPYGYVIMYEHKW